MTICFDGIMRGRKVVDPGVSGRGDEGDAGLDVASYEMDIEGNSMLSMGRKVLSTGEAAAVWVSLDMRVVGWKSGD